MKWAVVIARVILGGLFVFGSVAYFAKMTFEAKGEPPPLVEKYMSALHDSGYMNVVKAIELVGGLLVLASSRTVPLGLTLLTPVAVNILLFELFLLNAAGPGIVVVGLCVFLIWAYGHRFASVFPASPKLK